MTEAETPREKAAEATSKGEHRAVQFILRAGLLVASVLMAVGMVVHLISGHGRAPAVPLFSIFAQHEMGLFLTALGVAVLGLTPMVRVAALVVIWARERDWKFVGVAFAVVVVLTAAVVLGKG
jgi:uncharacterized membrane protein